MRRRTIQLASAFAMTMLFAAVASGRDGGEGFHRCDPGLRAGASAASDTKQNHIIAELLATPVAQGRSPGLIAAVIGPEGVLAAASAGLRKQGSTEAFALDDRVHIGSGAKAMTAAMLATLVADGSFPNGWNTAIPEVFPELSQTMDAAYVPVTLAQLVRMRGGIARDAANWRSHQSNPDIAARRYAILRDSLARPPAGRVGDFLYSNLSYMVAGAMAERLTGKTWEALMKERLFAPLEIDSAGFGPPGSPGCVDQPWGHRRSMFGDWIPRQFDNPQALGPAGTVHLSIADWAKFVSLWFPSGKPAALNRSGLTALTAPDSETYAAGWKVVSRSWAAGAALVHIGSNTYWHSVLWIAPNRETAFLAAANSSDGGTFAMLDSIIAALVGAEWKAAPAPTRAEASNLRSRPLAVSNRWRRSMRNSGRAPSHPSRRPTARRWAARCPIVRDGRSPSPVRTVLSGRP